MDLEPARQIDSFPYRHRLADLMTSPPLVVPPDMALAEAARRMDREGVSSLLVGTPAAVLGIVTERDVLRAAARLAEAFAATPLAAVMSTPVESLPADAFVYRALGRMQRHGIRHLGVTDGAGRMVGIITARTLLRQRAGGLFMLGDRIDAASDGAGLAAARAGLPQVAVSLLAEQVPARQIMAVVSAVLRDISARAAELAERAVTAEQGPAPSPWAFLVLGSGGRGESLLAADQDNAIVHRGGDDAWFAAVGRHAADLLDQAGIPYCRGGVMAANPPWRGSLAEWQGRIGHWIRAATGEALLNTDIFYDFRCVWGDGELAAALREAALAAAAESGVVLRLLAENSEALAPPLGLFGRLRTTNGRLDLKMGALLPLVGRARVMALRHRIAVTGTIERLRAVAQVVHLSAADVERLDAAHELVARLVLEQQLADLAADIPPSARVEVARLGRDRRASLRAALRQIDGMRLAVHDALVAG